MRGPEVVELVAAAEATRPDVVGDGRIVGREPFAADMADHRARTHLGCVPRVGSRATRDRVLGATTQLDQLAAARMSAQLPGHDTVTRSVENTG